MKTLTFNKPHNLSLLHDELLAALPALRSEEVVGRLDVRGQAIFAPRMSVEGHGDTITLKVPNNVDETAIQSIVQAHDSTEVQPDINADQKKELARFLRTDRGSWSLAQLQEIVELLVKHTQRG